jgi:ABC-type Fe3+/spermidine/putrescine transport system ATPase subunit
MVPEDNGRAQPGIVDLRLENIGRSFGSLKVIEELSLDIYKGELCCLLGPSGCGKTTLLKIINGLLEPDKGNVILAGNNITTLPCQKRDLGMVFQNYALFPHMDVFGNVAYGLKRRHVGKEDIARRVEESLSLVRLSGYDKRRVHELSGGQQQRVALARALVIEPRALLLDEPLSNLDAKLRADMRDEIKRIQSHLGITTVYVTHDQEEAMSIADRIVVMNNGDIEQTGTPREIYENPETQFVASFVGNINFIPGEYSGKELKLFGQTYSVNGVSDISAGGVTCAVRPERVRLGPAGESAINGVISRSAYYGSVVRYDITVGDGAGYREITAQVPVSSQVLEEGETVGITIDAGDIRLFAI